MEKYGFDVHAGGYTRYDGMLSNGKEISSVVVNTDTDTVLFSFTDGYKYKLSATVTQSGSTTTVTNINEEWGKNIT